MNNTEFKLIRESLHLSRHDLAELWNVSPRSVQRWDKGDMPIPEERKKMLESYNAIVNQAVENFINFIIDQKEHYETLDYICVVAYDSWSYDGEFPHYKMHNACLMRCRNALKSRFKTELHIVLFNPKEYEQWLKLNKETDSSAARSAWAALQ